MNFSIIIPNWNGQRLLEKNLPKVLETEADEVIVIDNGSNDGSVNLIKNLKLKIKNYNLKLKIIENKKNLGFAKAVNQGVKIARGEIVVLLNNDVQPEKDFLKPLVEDFQDEKVFAVSLNEPGASWAKGKWVRGFVEHQPGLKTKIPHFSFWASGGSGAFRRLIWLNLGGLDEIYKPFYWEDIDLCYRAWKRGFKILWEPKSIVYHHHASTIGLHFSQKYINFIAQRNQLLFIWKNITDPKMLFIHKVFLGKRLLTQPGYFKPFLTAWFRLPLIFPRWLKEIAEKKVSDEEIFKKFK